ncbi:unnamed protein product [Gordionus sp. m RMFG-2023]|uniref:uncharacterized protein LOC135924837 n=1 Tax=Gordionus sp. m RMFG-2023 TaxID=3053472 RepID=UPI0030DFA704
MNNFDILDDLYEDIKQIKGDVNYINVDKEVQTESTENEQIIKLETNIIALHHLAEERINELLDIRDKLMKENEVLRKELRCIKIKHNEQIKIKPNDDTLKNIPTSLNYPISIANIKSKDIEHLREQYKKTKEESIQKGYKDKSKVINNEIGHKGQSRSINKSKTSRESGFKDKIKDDPKKSRQSGSKNIPKCD